MLASARIIYSPHYNISFFGLERLHPFDSRKYARAFRLLRQSLGPSLHHAHLRPAHPATDADLRLVHTDVYLDKSLHSAPYIARAAEVPQLSRAPLWMIRWRLLRPMRYAAAGTILAARAAVEHGLSANLGGGFHHASPSQGHGFCLYADIPIAIARLRAENLLNSSDPILYIDLDAHQGDGICQSFATDRSVFIFDLYNRSIFPMDTEAQRRIDCNLPIPAQYSTSKYLDTLRSELPRFVNAIRSPKLAIYNAGTDILAGDPLGQLNVSAEGVLQRDQFVLRALRERNIPTVLLTSGGYTDESHRLIAATLTWMLTSAQ